MNVDEDMANTITEYSIAEKNIAEKNIVGNVREKKTDYDLFQW